MSPAYYSRFYAKIIKSIFIVFFFNDTATTEIYTLSLHDALPISSRASWRAAWSARCTPCAYATTVASRPARFTRSEEHTSELQSQSNLVCRLLLEKKKKQQPDHYSSNKPIQTSP